MTRLLVFLWLALVSLAVPAAAQTTPELTGRVVDQANLLSPQQEADLAAKSEMLEQQTGRQFVVATVDSLQGNEIEYYATELFRHWGIGDKNRDDGVLFLVAPNEKKVRIETGYGAEGFLPDILAGRIIRNDVLPKFREGDMAAGIAAGADAVIEQLSLSDEEARDRVQQAAQAEQRRQDDPRGALPVVFWFMIIAFVLLSMARRAGGRRYRTRRGGISPWIILWGLSEAARASRGHGGWGGGSWGGGGGSWGGGGGFGGFSGGGGSSGGGGASGSW